MSHRNHHNNHHQPSYEQRLQQHLEQHPYRPETIEQLGRMCRVGMLSEETALNMLIVLEQDHAASDREMAGNVVYPPLFAVETRVDL